MKVAIVSFHPVGGNVTNVGGVSTAPFYMKEMLEGYMDPNEVDIISLAKINKKLKQLPGIIYLDNYRKNPNVVSDLNKYDYIIFNTPGYSYESKSLNDKENRYGYLLDNLTTRYSFVINNEIDKSIFSHMDEFVNCSMYDGPMLNTPHGMQEQFSDLIKASDNYLEFNYFPKINALDNILKLANDKFNQGTKVIGSTARWTPRKRVEDLVADGKLYHDHGIKVYVYGGTSNYFYTQKIMKAYDKNKSYVEFKGEYDPSMLDEVMKPLMFHYNYVYLKRQTVHLNQRVELAPMEAFSRGVLPVLSEGTSPEWIGKAGAVRLNGDSDQHKIPEVISKIDKNDYLNRMESLYGAISHHQKKSAKSIYNYVKRNAERKA